MVGCARLKSPDKWFSQNLSHDEVNSNLHLITYDPNNITEAKVALNRRAPSVLLNMTIGVRKKDENKDNG